MAVTPKRGKSAMPAARTGRKGVGGLSARLSRVSLLVCDVDGVLTDGAIYITGESEAKRFDIQDGLGLVSLRSEGIKVAWVSSRPSSATTQRAEELKIDYVLQERRNKTAAVELLMAESGVSWEEVCYVGDDIVDLGPMRRAGVAVAVSNAVPEVKAVAHFVTSASGGHGAVREIAEAILKAQNRWERVVAARAG